MSQFGAVPDDFEYIFPSSRRPTEEERKNLAQQVSNAVIRVFNAGIINQQIALKELRESKDMTGMWNNITDEDIANADTTFGGGELPPLELPPLEDEVITDEMADVNNTPTEGNSVEVLDAIIV